MAYPKERNGARAASLEVRIPISPRADYYNRVRLIAHSIREFYPYATTRVSVGSDSPPIDLYRHCPWSRDLGIEWVWVDPNEFAEWRASAHPYIATMMERFRPPFTSEHILMLDADVMPIRPFDELLERDDRLLSMMAHSSPFRDHAMEWRALFEAYDLPEPRFAFEHSGYGIMAGGEERRYGPPYFNTGVVLARAVTYERLYAPYLKALGFVRDRMNSYFFEQIALTLAIEQLALPFEVLPLRYNYPNQPEFDASHPDELAQVRLLHFLRTQIVDREADFSSLEDVHNLSKRRDLLGSNEVLRKRIADLLREAG